MKSWHHARTQLTCGLCGEFIAPEERYQSVQIQGVRVGRIRCERCADEDDRPVPPVSSVTIGRARLEEIIEKQLGHRVDWRHLKAGGDE